METVKNNGTKQKKIRNGKEEPALTPSEKISYAVFENAQLGSDTIKAWLTKDIRNIYALLTEILGSQEILDAITKVLYANYQRFHEEKQKNPELDFNQEKEVAND